MSDRPATKRQRFLRLAGMTARVAGGYAKTRLQSVFQDDAAAASSLARAHERSGELVAKTLGELKGAVMKVGQMASVAGDLLPRELADALTSLQREAPPMGFDVIAEQIEAELGASPDRLFRHFERDPFAAASIGQVHRATTDDGRQVVVKVQYPGVDDAVDSDLAQLKLALRMSGLLRLSKAAADGLFAELRARLAEELDYCNEADNVRFFAETYRAHDRVAVPDVVGERSSARVLTLTYVPGDSLTQAASYPQDDRNALAYALFDMVADQAFRLRRLHADPNPANLAFRPDGTIVLYDFGCVKTLERSVIESYAATVSAALVEDYGGVDEGLTRLGARNHDGPAVPASFYKPWRDTLARPFLTGAFDYASATIQRDALKLLPSFLANYVGAFQPPPQLVFLDRVVVGHYGTLQRLGARVDLRPKLDAALAEVLAGVSDA